MIFLLQNSIKVQFTPILNFQILQEDQIYIETDSIWREKI